MQGFAPADEVLLFRQKDPKPFPPVCGPKGVPPPPYRIRWLRNSLRSNSLRQKSRFGTEAPPHPKAGYHRMNNLKSKTLAFSIEQFAPNQWASIVQKYVVLFRLLPWVATGPSPRIPPLGECCLSGASSLAILIRGDGPGPPLGSRTRKTWFWSLLPKQKRLVARGRNPA